MPKINADGPWVDLPKGMMFTLGDKIRLQLTDAFTHEMGITEWSRDQFERFVKQVNEFHSALKNQEAATP